MDLAQDPVNPGLEGVIAAQTRLSHVDGAGGVLVIAGEHVEQVAGTRSFEQVCARLWGQERVALGEARRAAWARLPALGDALKAHEGMDALRAAIAHLPGTSSAEEVVGAMAVFAAAWWRLRTGAQPLPPDASLGHAADLLRMLQGTKASEGAARALDAYLVTVVDHGMNASTFTARVIASTGSDLVSAVVGALGALKGPLHGGAPGPVLDMLDAIGTAEHAQTWLEAELEAGRRIMGMGHRIYRVRDPRAAVLEREVLGLERTGVRGGRLALARAVEHAATQVLARKYPNRSLQANVEFYTAVLLDLLGVDRAAFTPMFAVGRSAGWCAHVEEQCATGKLIRPDSRYVGPMPRE
jgi:citrate synthase